jgi:uncharacterized protein YuzE
LTGFGTRYASGCQNRIDRPAKAAPGAETRQIVEGLVVDLDADGNVVAFDIDHASAKLDLSASRPSRFRRRMPRSEARPGLTLPPQTRQKS